MDRRVLFASLVLFAGGATGVSVALFAFVGVDDGATEAEVVWESDPVAGDDGSGAVVATMDGDPLVLQSITENDTRSVRATAAGGGVEWTAPVDAGASGVGETEAGAEAGPAATSGLVTGNLGGDRVVAFTTESGSLVVRDAVDGSERFVADVGGRSGVRPAIGDVDGDGEREVVAVSTSGVVLAVDGGGEPVFETDVGDPIERRPLALDFGGDGSDGGSGDGGRNGVAVVTADGDEREISLLDGDGDTRWTTTPSVTPLTWQEADSQNGPVLALGGTNGNLETVEVADGSTRYEIGLQDLPVSVGDAGPGRVYVGGSGSIWAVSLLDGEVSWKQQYGGDTRVNAPSLGNVDGDDEVAPVAINREGDLLVLNRNGGVTARGSVDAVVYAGPLFADATGDGTDEVVVVTEDGRAVAVDAN